MTNFIKKRHAPKTISLRKQRWQYNSWQKTHPRQIEPLECPWEENIAKTTPHSNTTAGCKSCERLSITPPVGKFVSESF